ncbi:MAG: hypothetical protein RQ722_05165 [Desulfuromonadales bacterium]|nr:hypothetical protein [Desulfuromonadales bacterium]
MKLLIPTRPAELPEEALLARLRCRRAAIDLRAANHVTDVPAADVSLWVYRRLNSRLRKRLEPFLDLLAMRSLVLALRYALAGETPPAVVLGHCLLDEPLKRLVTMTAEPETIIEKLEEALGKDYPFAAGLVAAYRNQGPGGVEQQLADGMLQHGLARAESDILKATLRYLIDMRNCLMIHKLWRWQVRQAPPLTAGGRFATSGLQRIWATQDRDRLARLTTRLCGTPLTSADVVGMEQSLLKGLTRFLRRVGRDPLGLAVVIEYLWLAQLAVHNQILRQALSADRDELLEEVLLL